MQRHRGLLDSIFLSCSFTRTAIASGPHRAQGPRRPGWRDTPDGVTAGETTKNPENDLVGVDSRKDGLVDLLEALANPCWEACRLWRWQRGGA